MVESSQDFLPVRREASTVDMAALAEERAASAAERGVELTGDNGPLMARTRQVLQSDLIAVNTAWEPAAHADPDSKSAAGCDPDAPRYTTWKKYIEL